MIRTTIRLDDAIRLRLRGLAVARGVSMATIIREAIDEKLARLPPKPRSLRIGASGASDTARRAADERPQPRTWR